MEYRDALTILFRMILVSLVALAVIRFMGNRAVGQFSPFDFVIMVGIGDIIVTIAMDQNQSLVHGTAALAALLILQKVLSYLALKSPFLRKMLEGTPVTFIENGKILTENLKKNNFNYDDLRQELHKKGMDIANIHDIKIARLESCGEVSIIKNPDNEPLMRKDLNELVQNLYANPLDPVAQKVIKWEQFMNDVQELVEYIKRNDATK